MGIRISIPLLFICLACSPNPKGELDEEILSLELSYIAWACDCANWAKPEEIEKHYHNYEDTLAKLSVFIEAAKPTLELPDTLGWSGDIISFKGQFYHGLGYPKDYHSFEEPAPAKVFRYTEYEVIRSNYAKFKTSEK